MTKEKILNELNNYKALYESEKTKRQELEREIENIEEYQSLNLELQLKCREQEECITSLKRYNQILNDRNKTYETTFDILKGVDKNEYR